jgi:hypothetical protein
VTAHADGAPALPDAFLDKLVDWQDFERFVRDLYAEDADLQVEHDVTLAGKSGAPRQTDVLFRHRAGGHEYLTLVECKRWKEPVSRDRIDVLVASVRDLNASKGVMFTTTGYESGAEAYARDQGIELFLVRDLTDEEWGLPGRVVWFYMHTYSGKFINMKPPRAGMMLIPGQPIPQVNLAIRFGPDETPDPALTLHSADGRPGPNLMSVLADARMRVLHMIGNQLGVFANGSPGSIAYVVPLRLSFSDRSDRQLRYPEGVVTIEELEAELEVSVLQTRFEFDRGHNFDLALAVEHFMNHSRRVVTRRPSTPSLATFALPDPDSDGSASTEDVLQNGMLMKIFTDAWVTPGPSDSPPQRTGGVRFELPRLERHRIHPCRNDGVAEAPPSAQPAERAVFDRREDQAGVTTASSDSMVSIIPDAWFSGLVLLRPAQRVSTSGSRSPDGGSAQMRGSRF